MFLYDTHLTCIWQLVQYNINYVRCLFHTGFREDNLFITPNYHATLNLDNNHINMLMTIIVNEHMIYAVHPVLRKR